MKMDHIEKLINTKMIDNINTIKGLLNFENEGDFYMLYVFKRKKDQPEMVFLRYELSYVS